MTFHKPISFLLAINFNAYFILITMFGIALGTPIYSIESYVISGKLSIVASGQNNKLNL